MEFLFYNKETPNLLVSLLISLKIQKENDEWTLAELLEDNCNKLCFKQMYETIVSNWIYTQNNWTTTVEMCVKDLKN